MRGNKPQTLCWGCANATGGCCWSDYWKHRPVPGWKAERNDIRINSGLSAESYIVYECPEYVPDGHRRPLIRKI